MLVYLLKWQLKSETQQTIIFGATRYIVEYIAQLLTELGYECDHIYGAMDAAARKIALARFRNGRVRFLAVTDVAARGLDVPLLDNVVNYDVLFTYTHTSMFVVLSDELNCCFYC
jgi:superfamily II DNA/RNA helicase